MLVTALLASAASTTLTYPVQEILTAFGEVCFGHSEGRQSIPGGRSNWHNLATEEGWTNVTQPSERASAYRGDTLGRTYYWAKTLNYGLLDAMIGAGGSIQLGEEALFRKQVAGRDIYLSIFTVDSENPALAECRLRDPLGDGVKKVPISRISVETWLGHKVKRSTGWFHSDQYQWLDGNRRSALRVHFGFKRRELGRFDGSLDPYASYGMTLVRSDYSYEIVL